MVTSAQLVHAEDLHDLPGGVRYELIDGVLIELMPPGSEHGMIAANLVGRLWSFLQSHPGLGILLTEVGFVLRRDPDTVRAPDAAFIRADRVSGRLPKTFWEGAPDLAVEVVSPGDRPGEIQAKIREWIGAGARLVWVLYPDSPSIHIIRSLTDRWTLGPEDALDGGDVLPGFSCQVSDLFAEGT